MSDPVSGVKTYFVVNQATRTVEVTVHKDDYDAVVDNRDGWMASCGDWKERALAAEAELADLRCLVRNLLSYSIDFKDRRCPECEKDKGHLEECPWCWIKTVAKTHGIKVSR